MERERHTTDTNILKHVLAKERERVEEGELQQQEAVTEVASSAPSSAVSGPSCCISVIMKRRGGACVDQYAESLQCAYYFIVLGDQGNLCRQLCR